MTIAETRVDTTGGRYLPRREAGALGATGAARQAGRIERARASGLPRDSVANVSQIVTLDRDILSDLAGRLRGNLLKNVEGGLRLGLALQRH
jgi:mRNA-degrading endonuclease toxin of MazEF toxin-antitoxin module